MIPTAMLMSIAYIDSVIGSVDGKNLFIKILKIYASKRPVSYTHLRAHETREIGVRKAIGATKGMIMSQFLMESVTICSIAGLVGLLLAYVFSIFINKFFPSTLPITLSIYALSLIHI